MVESHPIRCTHFDAFRFFTPEAVGLNRLQPTRATQVDLDQPGCLHAAMDCHKWASKLGPAVPGALALDCFALAARHPAARHAGLAVRLELLRPAAGQDRNRGGQGGVRGRQREFARRAAALRARLIRVCDELLGPEAAAANREAVAPFNR